MRQTYPATAGRNPLWLRRATAVASLGMTVTIASVTFDCTDALAVGTFWSEALGRPLDPGASPDFAAIGFGGRRAPAGWGEVAHEHDPAFLFVPVPEGKTAKNRVHLDVV